MKIDLSILSGDNPYTTKFVAHQVGIQNYKSEMLPTDKTKQIQDLKSKGRIVAMAGDGINDAPSGEHSENISCEDDLYGTLSSIVTITGRPPTNSRTATMPSLFSS